MFPNWYLAPLACWGPRLIFTKCPLVRQKVSPCPTKMSPCPTNYPLFRQKCPLVRQKCPLGIQKCPLVKLVTAQCTVHLSTKAQPWLKGVSLFKQQSSDSPNLDLWYQMLDFNIWIFANSSILQPKPNHCRPYRRWAIEGRRPDKQRVVIIIVECSQKHKKAKLWWKLALVVKASLF